MKEIGFYSSNGYCINEKWKQINLKIKKETPRNMSF